MLDPIRAERLETTSGLSWTNHAERTMDPLTKLAGREAFLTLTAGALGRRDGSCAVLFIDIDGLRRINHGLGSIAGDEVLATVARRLVAASRPGDVVARLGGDEFAVLFAGLDNDEEPGVLTTRLAWAVESEYTVGVHPVQLRVSIGLAHGHPGDCSAESLLNDAEAAMYAAKSSGEGRLVLFNDELRRRSVDRYALEAAMRRTIDQGGFDLHYQPLFSLPDRRVIATEALLRWHDDQRGWISPVEFVPIAEETGLIVPLGHWVADTAIAQLAAWQRQGGNHAMSINVSPRQLADPDFIFQVRDLLTTTAVPAGSITFEITENQVMGNLGIAVPAMRTLRDFGARLAIDDFGTGYASLTQLKNIPADELKLDRSFIAGLEREGPDRDVVRAAIQVAHALGLTVVAEGVETETQLDCLADVGCDVIQGYLLGRPQPAGALSDVLGIGARPTVLVD